MNATPKPAQETPGNEVLRAISALCEPGDVIEIRALDVGRTQEHAGSTHAGYFNCENSSDVCSSDLTVDGRAEGVYVVLNRLNPELLARSSNRLRVRPKHTTTDADILEMRWLYIDADAVRPAGMSATDAEHEAALRRALEIREYLENCGWPEPIYCDSGSGGHLLYRLPALDLKSAGVLVKRCLMALAARFSDSKVKVDEATANPSRICKLYGTLARKGDSTADRPHRRSAILQRPERVEPVPVDAIEALASETAVTPAPTIEETRHPIHGDFDIDQWLLKWGLEVIKGPDPYRGGRKWTLRACLFNPEHLKPVVIELPSGALVYKCLHKSCSKNGWTVFRHLIEPS